MSDVDSAAAEIMSVLHGLSSPRRAAAAIATVRANLFMQGGAESERHVRAMMAQDDAAAFDIWTTITRTGLSSHVR